MTRVAWFSTDWQFEDVKGGKPGRKVAYYGGTYHYRMGLPCDELGKNGWDTMMSWAVRPAPDGHIQVLDHMGETWHDDCDVIVFQRWMRADAADMTRRAGPVARRSSRTSTTCSGRCRNRTSPTK